MLKFIKFFQGYLFVSISGYSPERFLNLCGKMNIILWNLKPNEDGYTFCLSYKAYGMLDTALQKTGTQIHIIKRIGMPFLLHKYRKHSFFLVGILCAFFLLFFMSQFIWKVEIDGNSYYSNQVLLDYLEENGIGYASLKKKINCKDLQTMLRAEYEDITWVSAKIEGTRLYLVIQERLKGSDSKEDALSETDAPAHLIADHDGVIESITTRQGTPLVIAGDSVSKGDILVSGAVDIMNDNGEVAARNYVKSDADVYIHTTLSYQDSFSADYEKKVPDGKKKYNFTIIFGNGYLDLKKTKSQDSYIETETTYPVVIGKDFYLPFQIVKKELIRYEIQSGSYSENEINQIAEDHFIQYYEKLKENGIQILSNSVIIEQSGDKVLVSGDLDVLVKQNTCRKISPDEMQEGTDLNGIDTADDGNSD